MKDSDIKPAALLSNVTDEEPPLAMGWNSIAT